MPNPLFDLAGIMCGQFGIPFWKFFLATLFGKAIIKTHIQVCHGLILSCDLGHYALVKVFAFGFNVSPKCFLHFTEALLFMKVYSS